MSPATVAARKLEEKATVAARRGDPEVAPNAPVAAPKPRRAPAPSHRSRPVRAASAPPRRLSGPLSGRARPAAPSTSQVAPARTPRVAPARTPRVAPARTPRVAPAAVVSAATLPAAALRLTLTLPDHRWLDRIVRGRAWIPVLGVLLVLIVGVQVEILKLGTSVGRSVAWAAELQSRNQLLQAVDTRLSDPGRIERLAAGYGMRMPGPTDVRFLAAAHGTGAVDRALGGMRSPDPQAFLSNLERQLQQDASAPVPPVSPATAGASAASTGAAAPAGGTGTAGGAAGTAASAGTGGTSASGAAGPGGGVDTGSTGIAPGSGATPSGARSTTPSVATTGGSTAAGTAPTGTTGTPSGASGGAGVG